MNSKGDELACFIFLRMNSDRSRQEQLARERLQARRKKRSEQQQQETAKEEVIDETAAETDDILALQVCND